MSKHTLEEDVLMHLAQECSSVNKVSQTGLQTHYNQQDAVPFL